MIIVGSCVPDDGEAFRALTSKSLEGLLGPDDVTLTESGAGGICAAYNALVDRARATPGCELLVLVHDDVEVVDPNFRAKLLRGAARPGAGVLGVVGASGLRNLEWWWARRTAGAVFETRGYVDLGSRDEEVDSLDGLLLALTPAAFSSLSFDEVSFPRFHGYDADICLQARASGLSNFVLPIDLIHRTRGGYGDRPAFDEADAALAMKWPQFVVPEPPVRPSATRAIAETRRSARAVARRVRDLAIRRQLHEAPPQPASAAPAASGPVPERVECPVCAASIPTNPDQLELRPVVGCPQCGLGITCPAPTRDVETDELWEQMYGDSRLQRRETWFGEAGARIDWVKLFAPGGVLLEVGCGTGEFVTTAQDNGYEAYGVEPSTWAADRAREIGADVITGFGSDWSTEFAGLRPDLVALWHVLEHVEDPTAFMHEIHGLLRPGGQMFLEVPNYASTNAQLLGRDWDGLQPDDHFHQFTPRSMRMLLEASEFEVQHLVEISPRIYLSTEQWRDATNGALLDRRPWPSLDYLRVVAVAR